MAPSAALIAGGGSRSLRIRHHRLRLIFVAAVMAWCSGPWPKSAAGLGLDFHHRFSSRVRHWAEERGVPAAAWWPERGTVEYYVALAHHDRARRGRFLAEGGGVDAFANGNATYQLSSLGFLYYAFVTLGTPNVTFLMALDTGSDLTWVPCDCIQCAPTTSSSYGNLVFDTYDPSNSSTSQNILCSNSLCELQSSCHGANSTCPYIVQYDDADTSTSGVLVEDVLYLVTEDVSPQIVETPIIFGCGEIQTGTFLDSGAPNGLFALSRANISVPSMLASKGLISNSFSMCFGDDGIGRINFGDEGSSDQQETPFILTGADTLYDIGITGMQVGTSFMNMSLNVIIDSGTSFTTLSDPIYTNLTETFNSQIQETRLANNPDLPFEYCYNFSTNQNSILLPEIYLTTKGGSTFPINDPIVTINLQQDQNIFCLAVSEGSGINIIGENFLTGLRIVFNREKQILGWEKFNCYKTGNTNNVSVNTNNSSGSSPSASSPSTYDPSETQAGKGNTAISIGGPSSRELLHSNRIAGLWLVPWLILHYLAIL